VQSFEIQAELVFFQMAESGSTVSAGFPGMWGSSSVAVGKFTVQGVCDKTTRSDTLQATITRKRIWIRHFGLCMNSVLGGLCVLVVSSGKRIVTEDGG
jgi:hypothetical protein